MYVSCKMTSAKSSPREDWNSRVVDRERILKREYPGWEVPQTYRRREKIFQSESIVSVDTELHHPGTRSGPVWQEQKL